MVRHGWSATFIALCCLGLGCDGSVGSKDDFGPAPDILFLDAAGTTLSSPFAARLQVAFGAVTLRTFSFSAANVAASVSFYALLAAADLSAGAATLTVSNASLGDGIANAQIVGVTGVADVDGAAVELHFSPSAVTGTLTPRSADASWILTGALVVECWVPRANLPASQQPSDGTAADGALFADATFAAPECASLRGIAGL